MRHTENVSVSRLRTQRGAGARKEYLSSMRQTCLKSTSCRRTLLVSLKTYNAVYHRTNKGHAH